MTRARDATGRLSVAASHDGVRTVVDTLRQDGLCRCSRPFAESNGAARLVTSQLGPGYVRDDRFTFDVAVGAGAELILETQSAARALGHGGVSEARTCIALARDAKLFFASEPLVAYDGAAHRARTDVTLADGASFAWVDCIAPHGAFECVTTSLRVTIAGRIVLHDALRLTPARLPAVIGSAYYLRAGMSAARSAALVTLADDLAAEVAVDGAAVAIELGIGTPAIGGVTVRARGDDARAIRSLLRNIIRHLRAHDAQPDRPSTSSG